MICLNCAKGAQASKCSLCDDCACICGGKCFKSRHYQKIAAHDIRKKAVFVAPNDEKKDIQFYGKNGKTKNAYIPSDEDIRGWIKKLDQEAIEREIRKCNKNNGRSRVPHKI